MHLRQILFATLVLCSLASAQQKFEVASIKPNAENDNRVMIRMLPGGRFTASGITLRMLIMQAYNVRDFQITNAPGWVSSDRFDINATAETDKDRLPPEEVRAMLRALLEERFQLKLHTDSKEAAIYALVPAKSGAKLTASKSEEPTQMRMGRGQLNAKKVSMAQFAEQLSNQVGRKVVDKTELTGQYDVALEWAPEPGHGAGGFPGGGGPPPPQEAIAGSGGSSGPSIFTALQESLGLRLEPQKGPVELLVIDSVSKPAAN